MSDQTISNIVTIVAVGFGWALASITEWAKKRYRTRTLKKALELEIEDALSWLYRAKTTLRETIKFGVLGKVLGVGFVKLPTHMFKQHFAEASLKLSKSERVSFNAIYNLLEIINKSFDSLEARIIACGMPPNDERVRDVLPLLNTIYFNICSAIMQIDYHLKNKKNLNIFTLDGAPAKQFEEDVKNDLNKLLKEAMTDSVNNG